MRKWLFVMLASYLWKKISRNGAAPITRRRSRMVR